MVVANESRLEAGGPRNVAIDPSCSIQAMLVAVRALR